MGPREALLLAHTRKAVETGEARATRLTWGLSLTEMATALDISPTTLWRWENSRRSPKGAAALRYGLLLEALRTRGTDDDSQ